MELPSDLRDYLKRGKQLNYDTSKAEAGKVEVCNLSEIKTGVVWISPEDEAVDGYFEVPTVNLISSCEAYDPEFILLWLPNEKVYGSWDCDHWTLTIFPDVSWSDIIKDPLPFLNAQWFPNNVIGKELNPVQDYKLNEGMPF